jgi:hypothetical protein
MTATIVETPAQMVAGAIASLTMNKGARFASLTYRNENGELAKHNVMIGVSNRKAYERDLALIEKYLKRSDLSALSRLAATEIRDSLQESLTKGLGFNSRYAHGPLANDTYLPILDGTVFVNKSDNEEDRGTVYVFAYAQSKTVIEAGEYKTVNSKPKTIEKNRIKKELHFRSAKLRQFKLRKIARAGMDGKVLVIVTEAP